MYTYRLMSWYAWRTIYSIFHRLDWTEFEKIEVDFLWTWIECCRVSSENEDFFEDTFSIPDTTVIPSSTFFLFFFFFFVVVFFFSSSSFFLLLLPGKFAGTVSLCPPWLRLWLWLLTAFCWPFFLHIVPSILFSIFSSYFHSDSNGVPVP